MYLVYLGNVVLLRPGAGRKRGNTISALITVERRKIYKEGVVLGVRGG